MSVKNPARSRPLSRNVKRLMRMARESPLNPEVEKIERKFTERDLAYCDMQGNIFMAAVDRDIPMGEFAPVFMNSQLAGVIDYSFSCAGGMEEDDVSNYLRMPVLLKSPSVIVDTVMWLDKIVRGVDPGESMNLAIVKALNDEPEDTLSVFSLATLSFPESALFLPPLAEANALLFSLWIFSDSDGSWEIVRLTDWSGSTDSRIEVYSFLILRFTERAALRMIAFMNSTAFFLRSKRSSRLIPCFLRSSCVMMQLIVLSLIFLNFKLFLRHRTDFLLTYHYTTQIVRKQ